MKKVIFGIALFYSSLVFAQQPETVYSITKEVREISWYEMQQKLWNQLIEKNKQDGNAWMNYYSATRALRNLASCETPEKTNKLIEKHNAQLKEIERQIAIAMPNSFEYYLISYSEQGFNGSSDALLKAKALRPFDTRILDELMIHYELERNQEQHQLYAQKMYQANELPVGSLNWGYNILAELEPNAILFTAGDNDTYATWIIQAAKRFRQDVTIINTSLILLENYRNKLFADLQLEPLAVDLKKVKTTEEYEQNVQQIFQHIFNGKRPVYVSTSAITGFEKTWENKLYLTGLAYKYSTVSFDNLSLIRRNYENRYLLDYLSQIFAFNIADKHAENFNGMYLPSMYKLYKHYKETEEFAKCEVLEKLLIVIAKQCSQETAVSELIGKSIN